MYKVVKVGVNPKSREIDWLYVTSREDKEYKFNPNVIKDLDIKYLEGVNYEVLTQVDKKLLTKQEIKEGRGIKELDANSPILGQVLMSIWVSRNIVKNYLESEGLVRFISAVNKKIGFKCGITGLRTDRDLVDKGELKASFSIIPDRELRLNSAEYTKRLEKIAINISKQAGLWVSMECLSTRIIIKVRVSIKTHALK